MGGGVGVGDDEVVGAEKVGLEGKGELEKDKSPTLQDKPDNTWPIRSRQFVTDFIIR